MNARLSKTSTKSSQSKKSRNSMVKKMSPEQKRKKSTHVYLNGKGLTSIPNLNEHSNLKVLYLQHNHLTDLKNLNTGSAKLTHLYLQQNEIKQLDNVPQMDFLKKLYLGQNSIFVVENLDGLRNLEELYVEKQNISSSLCFDPRTALALSNNLRILDLSGNQMTSISSLKPLKNLVYFKASNNRLDNLNDVTCTIRNWTSLTSLDLSKNPITKLRTYKESIIANCTYLELLDEKEVTELQRTFLTKFHEQRSNKNWKKPMNLGFQLEGLPNNYPVGVQKAVSLSILREAKEDKIQRDSFPFSSDYIPWNNFPRRKIIPKVGLQFRSYQEVREKKLSRQNISKFTLKL